MFGSLQSSPARELLKDFRIKVFEPETIFLAEEHQLYEKSSAILRILKELKRPYNWLYLLIVIPKPLRDRVYEFIARNRYRWFGKRESCMLPTPELKNRFIDGIVQRTD